MKDNFVPNDDVELCEEDIEHLITEDIDEYVRLAPVHNGKKVLSEKAWDALWDKLFGKYESKSSLSVDESRKYERMTREFFDKYECSF